MIKVYYGSNIDAITWKVYSDYLNKQIKFFPTGTTSTDVANQLCQVTLFVGDNNKDVFVVNINKWKFTDKTVLQNIRELHSISNLVILEYESSSVKNKIFNELEIDKVKSPNVTPKTKATMIHKLLTQNKISLDSNIEEMLVKTLPDQVDFIYNEILKLKLLNQKSFTVKDIKQIIFDLGDATIFNIADSWLNGNYEQTIERLNDLIAKNVTIQAFIPIFALKLMQIKLFLQAKVSKWSSEIITLKMSMPFWLQNNYNFLRPYDVNLEKVSKMLDKLYQFDINVKKQKNIPYTQLIKILFE